MSSTDVTSPSASKPKEDLVCFFAVDIETTGDFLAKDCCFAVGYAWGTSIDDVKTGSVCLDMKKGKDVTWKEFWQKNGYDMRCYNEFWSQHEDVLERLQDKTRSKPPIVTKKEPCSQHEDVLERFRDITPSHSNSLVGTKKEMVEEIQKFLTEIDKNYPQSVLITDTTAYDTVWLSNLLQGEGYPGIGYKRNGKFSKAIEMQSYRMAAYGFCPFLRYKDGAKPWETDQKYKVQVLDRVKHDHDPQNDAHQILRAFFVSVLEVQEKKDKEKLSVQSILISH
jgi:hypothetical protein